MPELVEVINIKDPNSISAVDASSDLLSKSNSNLRSTTTMIPASFDLWLGMGISFTVGVWMIKSRKEIVQRAPKPEKFLWRLLGRVPPWWMTSSDVQAEILVLLLGIIFVVMPFIVLLVRIFKR